MKVTYEEFVNKWIEASKEGKTQTQLAQDLDLTNSAVSTKKRILLDRGVELPALKKAKNANIDTDKLNDIIKGNS